MGFCRKTNIRKIAAIIFSAAVALAALPGSANATSCDLKIGNMNFGTISAINSAVSTSMQFSVQCSDYPASVTRSNALPWCVSVFPADDIDAAIATGENKRPIWLNGTKGTANARAIKFDFTMADYKDCTGCAWGGGPDPNYGSGYPGWAQPSKTDGSKSDAAGGSIAATSAGGQDITSGSYTGTFKIRLNWDDSNVPGGSDRTNGGKVQPNLLCSRGMNPTSGSNTQEKWFSITVSAKVKEACSLKTTAPIAFKPNISLDAVQPTQGSVQMSCSAGKINYQIGITKGNYADSYGTRSMRCDDPSKCGAHGIQYLLFQDAGYTRLWDDNFGGPRVLSGSCDGTCTRNIPIYAKVVSASTPPAGPYRDQVTIILKPTMAQ